MENEEVPTGIKIITILFYLFGFLFIASGFFGMFIGNFVYGPPSIDSFGFFFYVFLIILGIFVLFIGKNLKKGRNWARVVAIIFSIMGFIISVMNLILNLQLKIAITDFLTIIPSILINGFIFFYLLFSKKAKEFF